MRRAVTACLCAAALALAFAVSAHARDEDAHGHAPAAEHVTAEQHGTASQGAHGEEHVPSFHDFNWYYGMFGEKADVEPSLLWRPVGMPAPFGALLLNTAILYYILYRLLGKPIREGLKNRKTGILRGMEEAARMKREAEEQLQHYENKLASIDDEVSRIQREMRAAGEAERAHILAEARERRTRMERDAELLIGQELKAMREQLIRETVESAVRSAERIVKERLDDGDRQSLAEQHLFDLKNAAVSLRGRV